MLKGVTIVGIVIAIQEQLYPLIEFQADVLILSIDKEQVLVLLKKIFKYVNRKSLKVLCRFKELNSTMIHRLL